MSVAEIIGFVAGSKSILTAVAGAAGAGLLAWLRKREQPTGRHATIPAPTRQPTTGRREP